MPRNASLEAEKLMLYRSYDPKPALEQVRRLAGLHARGTEEAVSV